MRLSNCLHVSVRWGWAEPDGGCRLIHTWDLWCYHVWFLCAFAVSIFITDLGMVLLGRRKYYIQCDAAFSSIKWILAGWRHEESCLYHMHQQRVAPIVTSALWYTWSEYWKVPLLPRCLLSAWNSNISADYTLTTSMASAEAKNPNLCCRWSLPLL